MTEVLSRSDCLGIDCQILSDEAIFDGNLDVPTVTAHNHWRQEMVKVNAWERLLSAIV